MDLVEAGSLKASVDYVTCTTKTREASDVLVKRLYDAIGEDYLIGQRRTPWRFKGYHGQSLEGCRYGLRGDEAIVILSGNTAGRLWSEITPVATNVTRLDLAVTLALKSSDEAFAINQYHALRAGTNGLTNSLVVNTRGGSTLYVGSRQSRFYGRLYDKGAEQGGQKGKVWRWEVEVKKPVSKLVVAQLLKEKDPAAYIVEYVSNWFLTRGVECVTISTNLVSVMEISSTVQSPEKTLLWLTTQVKPSVQRLLIDGRRKEVIEALGLKQTKLNL